MLMRTDPFRDFDRLAQQVLGTAARPAVMPMELADDIPRPSSAGLLLGSQSGVFGLEVAVVGFQFAVAVFHTSQADSLVARPASRARCNPRRGPRPRRQLELTGRAVAGARKVANQIRAVRKTSRSNTASMRRRGWSGPRCSPWRRRC